MKSIHFTHIDIIPIVKTIKSGCDYNIQFFDLSIN